jgi:hypothetical protein
VKDGGTTANLHASQRMELRNPSSHIAAIAAPFAVYSDSPTPSRMQWRARRDLNPRPVPEARDDSLVPQVKSLLRYLSAPRALVAPPSMTSSCITTSPVGAIYDHA